MILDEFVTVKIVNQRIRDYYKNCGYDVSFYKIVVSVKHLLKNSHVEVNVKCDACGAEKKLKFLKYNSNLSKHNIYTCNNSCSQVKNRLTSMEKYGVEHHSKTINHKKLVSSKNKGINPSKYENRICIICNNEFKIRKLHKKITCSKICFKKLQQKQSYKDMILEKTQKTLMEKYGVLNQYQRIDVIKKLSDTRISKGLEIPEAKLSDWQKYRREVNKLTRRNKKTLFENWNGYDYYDGEYLIENLKLKHTDNSYPTIDHKFSVFYGFKNNISAEEISNINNLCITKRILNVLKRTKTEEEFINN